MPDRRQAPLPAGPARWLVRFGHCRDERGTVLFRSGPCWTVLGPDGTPLLRVVPDRAHVVTAKGFVAQVAGGALGGNLHHVAGLPASQHAATLARGTWSSPRLLQEVPGRMTVAALADTPRGVAITLLPPNRINDPLLARRLPAETVASARRLGPLAHQLTADGTARLVGGGGRVFARERTGRTGRIVEVLPGPLPALWLFGLLEAARWRCEPA